MSSIQEKTIVLADDDSDDRDLFREAMGLVSDSVQLAMVKDGEELMELLTNCPRDPDMIFLDLNMPRKNGKECLQAISNNDKWRGIPVVIYTTSINPRDVEECRKKGARNFIRKPNSFEELKTLLRNFLNDDLSGGNGVDS